MFKWPKLVWSFDYITQEAKMKICEREPWRNLGTLVVQRSFGAYSINSYRHFSSTVQSDSFWKFCAWLIAKLPRKIIFGLYYLYSRIRGPECRAVFENCKREIQYRADKINLGSYKPE
jgi:hypothetical protein